MGFDFAVQVAKKGSRVQNDMTDDVDIIAEVLGGNREAYAEIVRRYEGRVRGHCLMMLADPTQADDAAQEVFIKAYQSLGQFGNRSAFSTWLYRITANHCYDLLRKTARRKTESWEALLEREGEKIEALLARPSSGDGAADQIELLAKVFSCLPEKSRTILLLREKDGLSYQELAAALDCSLDAVKARLKRARRELEEKLRHFSKRGTSKQIEAEHES